MALKTSPKLKMAEQDILAAKSEYKEARGGGLPQMDLVGTTGPVEDARFPTVVLTSPTTGKIVSHDEGSWAIGIFGRLDFTLSQPIYTFGKISNRKDAAALGVEASEDARAAQRNKVVLEVEAALLRLSYSEEGKHAAGDATGYINDAERRIKRLIELKSPNVQENDLYRVRSLPGRSESICRQGESGRQSRLCRP